MRLTVNGKAETVSSRPEQSLLGVLREELGLTAAKPGCGEGECGACTVLVDGKPIRSCVTAATTVANGEVRTLEGLRDDEVWATVVAAFADLRAFQCGYCTAGMVVAAGALLLSNRNPTTDDIVDALNGNICRCGTYPRIERAIQRAAQHLRAGRKADSLDGATAPSQDQRFESGSDIPWDLVAPEERDWFDRLGDGIVAVLSPEESEHVNEERGGAWSTQGGAWLHVSPEGTVTAFTGKVDVGQDNVTELLAIVAGELRVQEDRVTLVMGDTDFCPYDIGTFGSRSTEDAGGVLGTTAAAARQWLDAHDGRVPSGTREVVVAEATTARLASDQVAGSQSFERRSALGIASGRTRYTSDISMPGMVLRDPFADNAEEADVAAVSEANLEQHLRTHPIDERGWEGAFEDERGNVERAIKKAAATYEQTFSTAYLAHVPLETRCAIASWNVGKVTIWTGTQRPFGVREQVAAELDIAEENVRVIVPPTGSGFGGKHSGEAAVQAARLARACGRPVKVRWTRAQEFSHAYFRPAALIDIRAGLDDRGRIAAWEHTNYNSGPMAIRTPYDVPSYRVRYQPTDSPLRTGSYRALAATANNFARESAMDELADLAGEDALKFRLRHLHDDRLADVVSQAALRAGWEERGSSDARALGIACGFEKGSRIATCVEVERSTDTGFRLTRIVAAYDCGAILDEDNLRNQIEGALVMGVGGALFEAVHFAYGRITNGSMKEYRVPRFRDVPPIEVLCVNRPAEPSVGAGETPIIAIAPAIANAIFALTGERRRSMPLLGEQKHGT